MKDLTQLIEILLKCQRIGINFPSEENDNGFVSFKKEIYGYTEKGPGKVLVQMIFKTKQIRKI